MTSLIAGCSVDREDPQDIGLSYFPLRTGYYHVYSVNEILYSEIEEPETLAYELRTEITDSFPSGDGQYTFVIHRSTRPDNLAPWGELDTWSVRGNDHELIVSEGNTAFLKLTFPPRAGTSWNGNRFNPHPEDIYEMTDVGEPFSVNGTTFDETLTVIQENNEDFIVFLDERREIYAKDVGMIYKELKQLNYCTDDSCLGQEKIESGRSYNQQLLEYGHD